MTDRALNQGERCLASEAATEHAGSLVASRLAAGVIYLRGDLGMGKTTFCRGLLRQTGYRGPVKSPTFTLVESYPGPGLEIHHFDLFRLACGDELEFIGLRDYLCEPSLCLFEWPERAQGMLPLADLEIKLTALDAGRRLSWRAFTAIGVGLSAELANAA